jgi:hypothetical protein
MKDMHGAQTLNTLFLQSVQLPPNMMYTNMSPGVDQLLQSDNQDFPFDQSIWGPGFADLLLQGCNSDPAGNIDLMDPYDALRLETSNVQPPPAPQPSLEHPLSVEDFVIRPAPDTQPLNIHPSISLGDSGSSCTHLSTDIDSRFTYTGSSGVRVCKGCALGRLIGGSLSQPT